MWGVSLSSFLLLHWMTCREERQGLLYNHVLTPAAQWEKIPKEILPSRSYGVKLFIVKLTPRRETRLNPISSQVPTNPEILDVMTKWIYFWDLLVKNVLIAWMVCSWAWRRGAYQGE